MSDQFGRKVSLVLTEGEKGLDLSEMHFTFSTVQQDVESPNNCAIRVYNLSEATLKLIRGEFSVVTLSAGYDGAFGVIFTGNIKQFRIGRERAIDTYLDILAADGDMAYNFATIGVTLASGWTHGQVIKESIAALSEYGVSAGYVDEKGLLGGTIPQPRGKVMWGLPRVQLRSSSLSTGATWNIHNGKVDVVPLDGYRPGQAVVLTSKTGLIGRPEQTAEGVRARCLLNPRIDVGALMQIDEASVNRLINQSPSQAPVPYDKWKGIQLLASIASDGLYRVYVAEHRGDTRGPDWYTDVVGLAVNPVTSKVEPYG